MTVSSLTRISITNPEVADIVSATDKEILLIAKDIGQSVLFIWDEHGKRAITIRVYGQNLDLVKERITNLLKAANITEVTLDVNQSEGKLVLVGDVPEEKKAQFDQIVAPFGDVIINLSQKEDDKNLIQVDLQITELSTTLFKAMGFDWSAGGAAGIKLTYPETLPSTDGSVGDFFKIGDFNRTSALLATVNALIREGKGKVLSQPKLVVVSGQQASFQVGGQIPIRTTSTSTTGTQENISFKDYGITMSITPKILKGKIDLNINAEVSDIDSANAVGQDVAFVTRNAQTKLYLDDDQTIVLAGLIKKNRGQTINRVPFLSKIPIAGMLFRSKATPSADTDTELVISLTPHILTDRAKEASLAKKKAQATENQETVEDISLPMKTSRMSSSSSTDNAVVMSQNMTEYIKNIQQKLTEAIHYPAEAQSYGWEGTTKLSLLILSDGTLAFATVKESSGFDALDQDAVATAKKAAPYDQFPPGANLQELEVTIPIMYSLQRK